MLKRRRHTYTHKQTQHTNNWMDQWVTSKTRIRKTNKTHILPWCECADSYTAKRKRPKIGCKSFQLSEQRIECLFKFDPLRLSVSIELDCGVWKYAHKTSRAIQAGGFTGNEAKRKTRLHEAGFDCRPVVQLIEASFDRFNTFTAETRVGTSVKMDGGLLGRVLHSAIILHSRLWSTTNVTSHASFRTLPFSSVYKAYWHLDTQTHPEKTLIIDYWAVFDKKTQNTHTHINV